MVSAWPTSPAESAVSAFSASTSTMARRLETTHSGSYVAFSSRVAPVVPRAGAGESGRELGSRREPGWLAIDPCTARGTDHLRRPRPTLAARAASGPILTCNPEFAPAECPPVTKRPPTGRLPFRAMRYPDTPRLDLVEDLHGHRIADPYRWLEDAADPRTQAWTGAQDALTAEVLGSLPLRDSFAARLE